MKKIGILTFHRSINYGAYMQCFSLLKRLQKELPDYKIEVIDYESKTMHDGYVPKFSPRCLIRPNLYSKRKRKYNGFLNALKHLKLSDKYYIFDGENDEFYQYISKNYDAIVVGSDAVWNWISRGFPNPYLMCFESEFKRFSYAASAYGMPMSCVCGGVKNLFSDSLKKFCFIGVRDNYTNDLVKSICPSQQPVFTCDPTMFLDKQQILSALGLTEEQFYAKMRKKYKIPTDKIVIGVMETDKSVVKAIRGKYGRKCYLVSLYNFLPGVNCNAIDLSPLEWALFFGLFDITITNYFHGTLLSLWNNVPVVSIDRTNFSQTNEGKIHDVMRRMDLLDCFFDKLNYNKILAQVDNILNSRKAYCDEINKNLNILKQSFTSFIKAVKENL